MKKDRIESWRSARAEGFLRFVLVYGLLAWGLPMFVVMTFMNAPFSEGVTATQAIVHYLTWPMAGLAFGAALWRYAEFRYKRAVAAGSTP